MKEKRFFKNVELWAKDSPVEAYRLESLGAGPWEFCCTWEGEENLVDRESGPQPRYLHPQEGARLEAKNWASILPLDKVEVVYVYGVGLGYYYEPLKEWLKSTDHYLVFIEEDPHVLFSFFQTELATEILKHPRVILKLLPCLKQGRLKNIDFILLWDQLRVEGASLIWSFVHKPCHVSALQAYFLSNFDFFNQFVPQWLLFLATAARRSEEFLNGHLMFFRNFYANLLKLPNAARGETLFDIFHSIPAIICGAGPSLAKQLPLLKQLNDKALIIGAGSGVNAVTRAGIMPHFGGAIDPNSTQASRLLTSFAHDMPIFYKNSFFSRALTLWHGQHLYISSYSQEDELDRTALWFEEKLGIRGKRPIIRGFSTANYLVEVAAALGCNPIILVGLDLAYTKGSRYAEGVTVHDSDSEREKQALTSKSENLIKVPGVNGEEVETNKQWFLEAVCMTAFKKRNPQVDFLNATEGGMPIMEVPNVSFEKVVGNFSTEMNMQGWLHGEIENAKGAMASSNQVSRLLEEWKLSLLRCRELILCLLEELENNQDRVDAGERLLYGPYTGLATLWQVELSELLAYRQLLVTYEVVFDISTKLQRQGLHKHKGKRLQMAYIRLEKNRMEYFLQITERHLRDLDKGEKTEEKWQKVLKKKCKNDLKLNYISPPEYRVSERIIKICEPDLEIDLKIPFNPSLIPEEMLPKIGDKKIPLALIGNLNGKREGQTFYFYPSGRIKIEAYYRKGELHGPWTFFSDQGEILARSWYVEGSLQGISCLYYRGGMLYCKQGYRNGVLHGEYSSGYLDGTLKTRARYENGLFEGDVELFYPNGQCKKRMKFVQGKLVGAEQWWNEDGTPLKL